MCPFGITNGIGIVSAIGRVKTGKCLRDTRFYSLFVQGRFYGNAKQRNAVFFSNIYDALPFVNHKAQLHLVWLHIVDI